MPLRQNPDKVLAFLTPEQRATLPPEVIQNMTRKEFKPSESLRLDQSEGEMIQQLLREYVRRRLDPLKMYEPTAMALAFHKSKASERLVVGGVRSGKTTCCAMEVAWAATGTHPYLNYPKQNGIVLCIAFDEDKIGTVMFRKLFGRDAFQMIKDPRNRMYRAWNPKVDGYDRRDLTGCKPLIDSRLIDRSKGTNGIAWERRAKNIPRCVYLKNGWEIRFMSHKGDPPRGIDVDLIWIDEESAGGGWYNELTSRLLDRKGRMIFSFAPQEGTDEMWQLHERAMAERLLPNPTIEEFAFPLYNNPFIDPQEIEGLKRRLAHDPEELGLRVFGHWKRASERVYPTFSKHLHLMEHFQIPPEWTRYMVVDPSWTGTVIIFFACPPKTEPPHVYAYDELYLSEMSVDQIAVALKPKLEGQVFQAFLVDDHGGRRGEMVGKSITQQFADAFKEHSIESVATKNRLIPIGESESSSKEDGINQVREWLRPKDFLDGRGTLQVFSDLCPKLTDEMGKYRYKKDRDGTLKKKANGSLATSDKYSGGPDCVRYAACFGISYIRPPKKNAFSNVYKQFLKELKAEWGERGRSIVLGPKGA